MNSSYQKFTFAQAVTQPAMLRILPGICCLLVAVQYSRSQSIDSTTAKSIIGNSGAGRFAPETADEVLHGFQDDQAKASSSSLDIPYPFNIFKTDPLTESLIDGKEAAPIPPGINLPPELMELYSKFAHLLPQLAQAHQNNVKQIEYCNPQNPNDGRKCEYYR